MAHVIHQYPVPETMGVAKGIFKRLTLLAGEIPSDMRGYFLAILPSVLLLCQTFPPLCSDATELLVHLMKIYQPADGSLSSILLTKRDESSGKRESTDLPLVKAIKNTSNEIVTFITA